MWILREDIDHGVFIAVEEIAVVRIKVVMGWIARLGASHLIQLVFFRRWVSNSYIPFYATGEGGPELEFWRCLLPACPLACSKGQLD